MVIQFLSKKKKSRPFVWIILCVCVLLFIFGKHISFIKPIIRTITLPLTSLGVSVQNTVGPTDSILRSRTDMFNEITALKKENELLTLRVGELSKTLGVENEFTGAFGTSLKESNYILAHVISKPNQSVYDTLILGVGKLDGIVVGKGIYVNKFAMLGIVENVSDHSAQVRLFSSPAEKTVARLERSGYDVTLIGRGGGNMIVEIPKEIETALGDRVVYPMNHNVVVGIIRDITLDDRDALKKLYITLPTNILTLDHVYIER